MDTIELVRAAVAGNAVDFKSMFDNMVGARVVDAIDQAKPVVAAQIFGNAQADDSTEAEQDNAEEEQDEQDAQAS